MGTYLPTVKYKNYSLPIPKPIRSQTFYHEKVWTLQEQIYKKLKKVAEFLETLHAQLTGEFSGNIKVVIEKNLEILTKDLDLMQRGLHKNPYLFNTSKLKTNQHCITEMKNVCDTLQTVRSYEYESKKLGKVKHLLSELEHLIQPTGSEKNLETTQVKSKLKTVSAKKKQALDTAKKPKSIAKKTKPTTKLIKQSEKKATKSKPKLRAASVLKAKPRSKSKLTAADKKK